MKTINIFVLLFVILLSNVNAGDKTTIIEKINNATTIPVYFITSDITVKQPEASPTTPLYPEEAKALKTVIPSIPLPEDYKSIYSSVVAELNKAFKVDKFVLGDISAVPTKTVTILGSETEVQDWNQLSDKFIVYASVSLRYYGGPYSRVDDKVKIDSYLEGSINIKCCNIVDEKAPLSYMNPAGVNIFVKGEKFSQLGIFTTMEQFTEKAAPNSLVTMLNEKVPGSLDKFYEKQKKKFDKANK